MRNQEIVHATDTNGHTMCGIGLDSQTDSFWKGIGYWDIKVTCKRCLSMKDPKRQVIKFRVTENEYQEINRLADLNHMTLSEYIRSLVLAP